MYMYNNTPEEFHFTESEVANLENIDSTFRLCRTSFRLCRTVFMKVSRYLKLGVTPLERIAAGLAQTARNTKQQVKSYFMCTEI